MKQRRHFKVAVAVIYVANKQHTAVAPVAQVVGNKAGDYAIAVLTGGDQHPVLIALTKIKHVWIAKRMARIHWRRREGVCRMFAPVHHIGAGGVHDHLDW